MTRLAAEVGGTFTDLVWVDDGGRVKTHKVPSTPGDPSIGVMNGLDEALADSPEKLSQFVHGSTVATNAVLERKGCRAALITTRGFRDLLVLQRQIRPNVYSLAVHKPEPLVPLSRTIEIDERMSAAGEVLKPLDEAALVAAIDRLVAAEKPDAVAVCLLHAYQNPAHEQLVRDVLANRYPDLPVVLSSDVLPTFREYERASTTVMAAYLVPLVGRYLGKLESELGRRSKDASLLIMQSSGGVLPSEGARSRSVEMLNSGPAGGVIAAVRVAAALGDQNLITLDVGGTSSDVCLIAAGSPDITSESQIDGLPIGMPSIDIANVGAGGGSIGWIDRGGMLQVGPRSAGARPGPACYGHGGEEPTLTDALVRLGWIRPHRFLGGRMNLHADRADAVLTVLANRLGQSADRIAQAMVDIAVAHVSRCVRLVSVQRGRDPKGYALYGYGGMGPALAAQVADELGITRVVIPPHPGLFSSLGLLVADVKRVYRETGFLAVDADAPTKIVDGFERMRAAALQEFEAYGSKSADMNWEYLLEMRSRGQGFELLCPIELDRLKAEGPAYLAGLFRDTHIARYGTAPINDHVELVTYQLVANVPGSRGVLDRLSPPRSSAAPKRDDGAIRFRHDRSTCPFAWREELPQGWRQKGLAVIEEPTATTVVPPGWTASVGILGALELTKEKA